MRDYVIINGVNSLTINGLAISKLPPISKPLMRNMKEEIDGRDGDIITELGYSAYDKTMEIGLYGNFDINEVISFFNGEGTITFSNEEDKHYYFKILEQIDYEKLLKFKTATITFHCQPFKYPNNEQIIDVDSLTVEGTGTDITLANTSLYAPINTELLGDTTQDGTPTPESPIEIETVTGRQEINIYEKNLLDLKDGSYSQNGITAVVSNGEITLNGTASANAFVSISTNNKIIFNENTSYTISAFNSISNSNVIIRINSGGQLDTILNSINKTQTINTNSYTDMFSNAITIRVQNGTTLSNFKLKPMIEKGTTASEYEEYKGQNYEINLGKNLYYGYTYSRTVDGMSYTCNENGTILCNGLSASGTTSVNTTEGRNHLIILQPNTTYTLSGGYDGNVQVQLCDYYGALITSSGTTSSTFTTSTETRFYIRVWVKSGITVENLYIYPQLEKGNKATSYSPYKTPIELCKIGNYQDRIYKENGKWYLTKEIGKIVLNGTENINYRGDGRFDIELPSNSGTYAILGLSNYYLYTNNWDTHINTNGTFSIQNINWGANKCRMSFKNTNYSSLSDVQTGISSNNIIVYYQITSNIGTPTTTEIADTELLAQLNLLSNATTYDETTNILSKGDLPSILNVSATSIPTTTITNIGNIYAKPLLTIKGSGDISVYLNGIQLLQISLGDREEITIDISKMEAYDEDTKVLLNRLVIGDYSKFLINSGVNELLITGDVSNFTMSNYTRWL